MLKFWLLCPILAFAAFLFGALVRALAGVSSKDMGPWVLSNIPFAIACMLCAVALLAIWSDIETNQNLSSEDKKQWKLRFFVFYPLAAIRYW